MSTYAGLAFGPQVSAAADWCFSVAVLLGAPVAAAFAVRVVRAPARLRLALIGRLYARDDPTDEGRRQGTLALMLLANYCALTPILRIPR